MIQNYIQSEILFTFIWALSLAVAVWREMKNIPFCVLS